MNILQQMEDDINQQVFELDLDFDDLEKEEYDCYNCAWIGSDFVEQETSLFGSQLDDDDEDLEKILLCPICGEMLT